jgi:hypothetical protein
MIMGDPVFLAVCAAKEFQSDLPSASMYILIAYQSIKYMFASIE